jgi:hypothetical protein
MGRPSLSIASHRLRVSCFDADCSLSAVEMVEPGPLDGDTRTRVLGRLSVLEKV